MRKRRRVLSRRRPAQTETLASENCFQRHTLESLPPEVLEMILRLLPLQEVACTIRLVSRHCSTVCTTVLNAAFLTAGARLELAMKRIEAMMPKVKTETELLACSKTFNALEVIMAQYKMLRAVTWRYTHPSRQQKFPRLCFYAGSLLDDLNNFLRRAINQPNVLATFPSHGQDPSVTCFVAICKRFMNYFEKVSERRVNRSPLVSGCKVVDLLDCLAEGRQVLSLRVSSSNTRMKSGIVRMRIKYIMKRTWFTCLEIPCAANENSWKDAQRFMYLRLRRLVGSVNEHLFEKLHYERELFLQAPLMPPPSPPPASTYSGYGEYGDQFFYYGNMNEYAYENKFKVPSTADRHGSRVETEDVHRPPHFDLVVVVEFNCTPDLAPYLIKTVLKTDDFESHNVSVNNQELSLKLNVTCPASEANRLPNRFTWELQSPRTANGSRYSKVENYSYPQHSDA